MVKVIFLDIDGVLTPFDRELAPDTGLPKLCHKAIFLLSLLCRLDEKVETKIVISSTWRMQLEKEAMIEYLCTYGLKPNHFHNDWRTTVSFVGTRGAEIQEWLSRHQSSADKFVILDDLSKYNFLKEQERYHVKPDNNLGFSCSDLKRACVILHEINIDVSELEEYLAVPGCDPILQRALAEANITAGNINLDLIGEIKEVPLLSKTPVKKKIWWDSLKRIFCIRPAVNSKDNSKPVVGITFGLKSFLVKQTVPFSAADRAGIYEGDKLTSINGKSTSLMTGEEALQMLRSWSGEPWVLTLERRGEEYSCTIKELSGPLAKTNLAMGKYTRWALDITEDELEGLLKAVGAFALEAPIVLAHLEKSGLRVGFTGRAIAGLEILARTVNEDKRFAREQEFREQLYAGAGGHVYDAALEAEENYSPDELIFADAYRKRLLKGVHTAWAAELTVDELSGVLWARGEYAARAEKLFDCLQELQLSALTQVALEALAGCGADTFSDFEQRLPTGFQINSYEDVVIGLDCAAWDHVNKGNQNTAEVLFKRALAISQKEWGANSLSEGKSLLGLAHINFKQSKYIEADTLYKKALEIFDGEMDAGNICVVSCLEGLAAIHWEQEDFIQAESLYKRCLSILEKLNQGYHQDRTISILEWLAMCYHVQSRYTYAEPLLKRALSLSEDLPRTDFQAQASVVFNLAMCTESQRKFKESEAYYQRTLDICEKAFGREHQELVTVIDRLANLYSRQGKVEEAESMFERALSIIEKLFMNPAEPDISSSLQSQASKLFEDYAALLRRTKQEAKANYLEERARSIMDIAKPD